MKGKERHPTFDAAMNLAATLGVSSKDPELRRPSEAFLAFKARDELLEHEQRQNDALEALAAAQSTNAPVSPPPLKDQPRTGDEMLAFHDTIQRLVRQAPDREHLSLYRNFALR